MRRLAVMAVLLVGASGFAVAGARGSDEHYLLRAFFDNGSGLRTGMEVRVAGLRVGTLRSVDLDASQPARPKAVAVLEITDDGVADFRRDGRCAIRSSSLLGDRFLDCRPTQRRRPGTPPPPPLATVEVEGERQHLMPVSRTSSPVDPDLVLDIFRLPVRQRLSIIVNELGTGLAGNGRALREAIQRADPAFLQLDRTLDILAAHRRALARLARSSDRVLEPLAREREHLAGLVVRGDELFDSVAARRRALRTTFRRLPAFLRELRPTLRTLHGLTDEARPALADLDAAAGRLSQATVALEPTAREGTRGLRRLGAAAQSQATGLREVRPALAQLGRLAPVSRPVWRNLAELLASLRRSGGLVRLADSPVALGRVVNGFDRYGYYARTNALVTSCTTYALRVATTCGGTFVQPGAGAASAEPLLDYVLGSDG
jgi:phospholipid/cholesterol/gamma-HCH transport system substrate-binding protein